MTTDVNSDAQGEHAGNEIIISAPLRASELFAPSFSDELVRVTPLGGDRYRVITVPLYAESVNYRDIVTIRRRPDNSIPLLDEVVEASHFVRYRLIGVNITVDERISLLDSLRTLGCVIQDDPSTGVAGLAIAPAEMADFVGRVLAEAQLEGMIDMELIA